MRAKPRERDEIESQGPDEWDRARAEWSTRMAWSMTVAVALHAAALASWGRLQMPPALDPELDLAAAGQPQWIFLDEAVSLGLEGAGAGRSAPTSLPPAREARSLTGDVGEPEPTTLDPLRDRLVGATTFGPSIAGFDGPGGVPTIDAVTAAPGGGSSTARLSDAEGQALQGLSELDLERLSAVRPEVALEAMSYWVLVRNVGEVREFMRRNRSTAADAVRGIGTVSVALWVTSEGVVEWAEVITSSGKPEWDELALELFSEVILFRPARLEGIAMPTSAIFTVNFPWL